MSTKELTRWVVMRRVRDELMSRRAAAVRLGLSYRQVKRLFARFRARGQKGLVHGNFGQRSNRAHASAVCAQAVALIAAHFSGPARGAGQRFGPTLAASRASGRARADGWQFPRVA